MTMESLSDSKLHEILTLVSTEAIDPGTSALERSPLAQGTFPKEIVSISGQGGDGVRLLVKYDVGGVGLSYGHRGGVPYELRAITEVLPALGIEEPRLVASGATQDGRTWFASEYLEGSLRVNKIADATAMLQAAQWVGEFHRIAEETFGTNPPSFVARYGHDYYAGWAHRTMQRSWPGETRWVPDACRTFLRYADELSSGSSTLIHGEYYVKNILWHEGAIVPVDWESLAFASGVIDIATLSDGWPAVDREQLVSAYFAARWPDGVPPKTDRLLQLAEAYVQLRWLSEGGDFDALQWRLDRFDRIATSLRDP